jgi:hypothetical protein
MKIKSIEELEDKLGQDIAWRKKEMFSLRIMIERDELNRRILLRAGIALLCAHFEGFVKIASNFYVIYVSDKRIKCENIINPLLSLKLENDFKTCSKSEKCSVHTLLIDKIDDAKKQKFVLKYTDNNPIISTESNPKFEVLHEILKSIGIESDIFDTKRMYIDNSLLNNRNKVVHGERHELVVEDFTSLFDIIIELIERYKELIINSAEKELYLKKALEVQNAKYYGNYK